MDEILYLEPDEEITTVIDKLKKANSDSVGLVIPRSATLVHSIVNLKLLKKEAERAGKEIALVMTDRIGKNIASQVGIPVYEDVHAKRPVNAHTMPDMPKGDEVIEVDMSAGHTKEPAADRSTGDEPIVKQYSATSADEPEQSDSFRKQPIASVRDEESAKVHRESPKERETFDRPKHRTGSRKRLITVVIVLIVLLAASVLGLPQSTILITVAAEPFEQSVPIIVASEKKAETDQSISASGQLLQVENDDAQRVTATGKKDVGGKATGSVTISNAWDSTPIKLAAGTDFTSTDGKVFDLAEAVTVPGATATLSQGQLVATPGKVTGTLNATEPGDAYNIKPTKFTIQNIPSERKEKIFGESSKDFTGGFTKQVNVMTQTDIDTAKDSIVGDLKDKAKQEFGKQGKEQKLLGEAATTEIVSVETNPKSVGSETDYFDLKVKVKHQVMVFDEKAINTAVDTAVREKVPDNKELLLGEDDEFVIEVDKTDYENGQLLLLAKVKTKIGTRVDPQEARQGLAGKNEAEVKQTLAGLPNVKDIKLQKFPSWWWQGVSFAPWNTRVKVIYE